MRIYTQNTPNSARSHYNINSGIHINLITINNASLSHNSKHVRLLQERMLNHPDFSCHHRRPPLKGGNLPWRFTRSLGNLGPLSTNCFVYNIYPLYPSYIRSIQPHVYDRYNCTMLYATFIFPFAMVLGVCR